MPIPAIIAAAVRVLGPMIAEGAAGATAARVGASAAARGVATRAAAGTAGRAAAGGAERTTLQKLGRTMAQNPPSFGNNGPGGPPTDYQINNSPPGGKGPSGIDNGEPNSIKDNIKAVMSGEFRNAPGMLVKEATKGVDQTRRMVENDYAGMLTHNDAIPEPVRKLIKSLDDLAKTIVDKTDELAKWDSRLTGASVDRKISLMGADQREAERVGGSYSRVTNAYTELEVGLRDTFNPVKDGIADLLATALELLNAVRRMTLIVPMMEAVGGTLNIISDVMSGNWTKLEEDLQQLPVRIAKAIKEWALGKSKEEGLGPMAILFTNTGLQLPAARGAAPLPNAKDAPLGIKLL